MSETLSQTVPSKPIRTGGLTVSLFHLLILSALVFAPYQLAVAAPDNSMHADSSAPATSADSLRGDSTASGNATDSLIKSLGRSGTGGHEDSQLDLSYDKPGTVFSAKNISMVLIVIGLLVLFMHFLRKYLFRPLGGGITGGEFQVVRQYHLGPKKSVALVRFAGRLLLLGVTDGNINLLTEIDDPDEVEKIISSTAGSGDNPGGAFRDIYRNLISRAGKSSK